MAAYASTSIFPDRRQRVGLDPAAWSLGSIVTDHSDGFSRRTRRVRNRGCSRVSAADQMRRVRTVAVTITPLLCDIISELVAERAPIDIVARLDSRYQLKLLQTLTDQTRY